MTILIHVFHFLSYMKKKSHVLPSVSNLSFDNKITDVMVTMPYTEKIKSIRYLIRYNLSIPYQKTSYNNIGINICSTYAQRRKMQSKMLQLHDCFMYLFV